MTRILALFYARNIEFFRDRAALGWNLVFPVLLVFGFSFAFSGAGKPLYKLGVTGQETASFEHSLDLKYTRFVNYPDFSSAMEKLKHHQIDLLIDVDNKKYWFNTDSPTGYFAEKILRSNALADGFEKQEISGKSIRYVDWVLPGIIGMNMMFSGLFGVGYVIVRYRKNGVLKRLKATPLSALEFLLAQILSRLFIILLVSSGVYFGCHQFVHFYMAGSYLDLLLVVALGAMSIISLGLLMASQTKSEEFAGGLLNMISWPMMFLSGVWFSLEGSPDWLQQVAQIFPLTHLISGARAIMLEGASLAQVWHQCVVLIAMTAIFLIVGSWRFNWGE